MEDNKDLKENIEEIKETEVDSSTEVVENSIETVEDSTEVEEVKSETPDVEPYDGVNKSSGCFGPFLRLAVLIFMMVGFVWCTLEFYAPSEERIEIYAKIEEATGITVPTLNKETYSDKQAAEEEAEYAAAETTGQDTTTETEQTSSRREEREVPRVTEKGQTQQAERDAEQAAEEQLEYVDGEPEGEWNIVDSGDDEWTGEDQAAWEAEQAEKEAQEQAEKEAAEKAKEEELAARQAAEIEAYNAELYSYVDPVIDQIIESGMTDLEKEKAVYEWIVTNIKYDYDALNSGDLTESSDPLSVIKNGKGVCTGISELFYVFMERLGIPCKIINSPSQDHTWNEVYIDGEWKNVDATWATNNYAAGADIYQFFNQPDSAFNESHYGGIEGDPWACIYSQVIYGYY